MTLYFRLILNTCQVVNTKLLSTLLPLPTTTYARYLQLLIDGMRQSPGAGDLGPPLTRDEVDALARQWMPSSQQRRP